ncbi:MAG: hypothetical protein PHQ64_02560 [Bacilli bacterium]|nr:hypothetical protein [Bacilli bacterium]
MDILFEIIFDGIIEIVKNKKISKYIRYPLLGIVSLVYLFVLLLFLYIGVIMIEKNILITLLMIGIFILLLCFVYKFYILLFKEEKHE